MSLADASQIAPELSGVPETMLWALHNRASEASRADGVLTDPDSVRIHQSIDYDYARFFGSPGGSLASRAAEIDRTLRRWIVSHPDGVVISLGEGLETQARRVDNGRIRWLSVDLPEAIRLRERFLPPTERFRQIAGSAADLGWMDAVDDRSGVFIVAQGLLMYLQPALIRGLFAAIARRFPVADVVFDVVPRWFSRLTLIGLNQTPSYTLPPMPWGINRNEIEPLLRRWMPSLARVEFLDYRVPRGLPHLATRLIEHVPYVRHELPSLVHVTLDAPARGTGLLDGARCDASAGNGLAVAAVPGPFGADGAGFGRMLPERMKAVSAAGILMLDRSGQAGRAIARLLSDEVMVTAGATMAIAASRAPMAMAAAQGRFAAAWFDRAAANAFTMGMLALRAQAAAMGPVQRTVPPTAE